MKKSVILILIAVYILSICIVGFLGLNVRLYAPTVKPEKIEITAVIYDNNKTVDYKVSEVDGKSVKRATINYKDGDTVTVELANTITPDNATNKNVTYELQNTNPNIVINEGKITFTKPENSNLPLGMTIRVRLDGNPIVYDEIEVKVKFK